MDAQLSSPTPTPRNAWEETEGPKQECRQAIADATAHYIGTPRWFLSLTADNAYCVKTFKKKFPTATAIGVEKDPEVFKRIHPRVDLKFNTDVAGYSQSMRALKSGNHLDAVFLDYFGGPTAERLSEIQEFVSNPYLCQKGKESILAVTFMKVLRHEMEDNLDFLASHAVLDPDEEEFEYNLDSLRLGLSHLMVEARPMNVSYLKGWEYQARKRSKAMFFLLFKLEF